MKQRQRPAPERRVTATAAELDGLARVIGVRLTPSAGAAVLDPRGPVFQRAEWLGDSILDALTADLRMHDPSCADHTSDAALTQQLLASGLGKLLDWTPGEERLADLLEAVLGLAWLAGGWDVARAVAARLIDPAFAGDVLRRGRSVGLPDLLGAAAAEPDGSDARAGSAILEAAAAVLLFKAHPETDEGGLSTLRRPLLESRQLAAAFAPACAVRRGRDPIHAADHIQAVVGRMLRTHTLPAVVDSAMSIVSTLSVGRRYSASSD